MGGLGAAVAAVAAGCGSAEEPASSSSTTSASAKDGSDDAGPITLKHQFGSTKIPGRPQRVVTMTGSWTDALIALGVPITGEYVTRGYNGPGNTFEWTPAHKSEIVEMTDTTEVSLERLARFRPDLILAGYVPGKEIYAKFSQVAPTIPVMATKAVLDPWQDVTTTAGKIFGLEAKAAELVGTTERQVDDFRAGFPAAAGKTFVFGQLTQDGQFGLVADENDPATKLITAATGLELHPAIKTVAKGGTRVLVSAERIDLLGADVVLMWPLAGGPEQFGKVAGWNSLPAVKKQTTIFLTNDNASAFGNPTIYSVPYTLDLFRPAMRRLVG
ncbi:iron-siderophore ABC transporter substrate-binding protein [Flindersiella endophytica]